MKPRQEKFSPLPGFEEWLDLKLLVETSSAFVEKYPAPSHKLTHQAMLADLRSLADTLVNEFEKRLAALESQKPAPEPINDDYFEKMWTEKETAKVIGYNAVYLSQLRRRRQGPPFYKVGDRRIMYKASDVRDWLAQRKTDPK